MQLVLRVVNQDDRAVALARVEAVCRQPDVDEPEAPEAPVAEAASWPDEYERICGGETFL